MVKYGKVKKTNIQGGIIVSQDLEVIDYLNEDISFNKKINVGDVVSFRVEDRPPLKLARNILILSNENNNTERNDNGFNIEKK